MLRGKCYLFISDSFDDMEEIKENVDPKRTTPTSESGGFSSTADNVDPKPTTPTSESGDVSLTEDNVDSKPTTPTSEIGDVCLTEDNVAPTLESEEVRTSSPSSESLQQAVARLEKGINKLFGVF